MTRPASVPVLSVVVPVLNGREILPMSLGALAGSDLPRDQWELIVVDDGSTDDSLAVASRWADREVRIEDGPRGPAHARNRAAEVATGTLDRACLYVTAGLGLDDALTRAGADDDHPARQLSTAREGEPSAVDALTAASTWAHTKEVRAAHLNAEGVPLATAVPFLTFTLPAMVLLIVTGWSALANG
jgi:glycosyltransferase involved in cell wall biosynthesis